MLKESILKAVLGTSRNEIKIEKASNGGFAIQSADTVESSFYQYQTWEVTNLNLYVDKDGNIEDGEYGIEFISQPSCEEIESVNIVDFGTDVFNGRLDRNLKDAKEKPELVKVVNGLLSVLEMMKVHDVVKFKYKYFTDEVSEFEYIPFVKKEAV
nr:MAG TPA: hypothetical protein [Caudoviricetes sp.]